MLGRSPRGRAFRASAYAPLPQAATKGATIPNAWIFMKKLDKLLTKILIFSIILFTFSIIFSKKEKSSPKPVESALLNPKYKNEVSEIEIQIPSQNGAITLKKQGDFWLLVKNEGKGTAEIRTFADKKLVTSFIEKTSEIRRLYQVSDRESDFEGLETSDNTGITANFSGNNSKMYTKLHFGSTNSITNRTFVRSEGSKITYETENDLSQFLTTDTNYWSEGEILPGDILKRTKLVEMSFEEKSVKSTLDEKSENFVSKSGTLLSLRHGSIKSEEDFLSIMQGQNPNPAAILNAQDGSGRKIRIEFFEYEEENHSDSEREAASKDFSKSYLYKKSVIPSPAETQENAFAYYSENAFYEISAWTYDKIRAQFF